MLLVSQRLAQHHQFQTNIPLNHINNEQADSDPGPGSGGDGGAGLDHPQESNERRVVSS